MKREMKEKAYPWGRRTFKELDVLGSRITEILAENGIYAVCTSLYERKDHIIKIGLEVSPPDVLKERGILK